MSSAFIPPYSQVTQADPDESASSLLAKLKENRAHPEQAEIRYEAGKRLVRNWRHLPAPQSGAVPWKDEGVYLLTGGAGGIGLIFAEEIASRVKNAVLIFPPCRGQEAGSAFFSSAFL